MYIHIRIHQYTSIDVYAYIYIYIYICMYFVYAKQLINNIKIITKEIRVNTCTCISVHVYVLGFRV